MGHYTWLIEVSVSSNTFSSFSRKFQSIGVVARDKFYIDATLMKIDRVSLALNLRHTHTAPYCTENVKNALTLTTA